LLSYEFLQKVFHPEDIIVAPPTNAPVAPEDRPTQPPFIHLSSGSSVADEVEIK